MISNISMIDCEITLRCNLDCGYCYLGANCHERHDMSEETARLVLRLADMVPAPRNAHKNSRFPTINLYGGEPMLRMDFIRWMSSEAETLAPRARLHVVTNGTVGSEDDAAFLKHRGITCQRSAGGCPESCAAMRPGSLDAYERRTPLFDKMNSRRVTVTPEAAPYMLKSIRYLESKGFAKGGAFVPAFEVSWSRAAIDAFKDQMWQIAAEMIVDIRSGKRIWQFWFFDKFLPALGRVRSRRSKMGCGAGKTVFGVSWDGKVVPCARFTGADAEGDFCLGTVADLVDGRSRGFGDEWVNYRARCISGWRPTQCEDCIADVACAMNCAASNRDCTGRLDEPPPVYCEFMCEAARIVRWMDTKLRVDYPDWWDKDGGRKPQQIAR